MALPVKTTAEAKALNLSNLEASIGQKAPTNEKAFLRVLAILQALNYTSLTRYAAERVAQNFAMTATGEDLERIGREFGVYRKAAEAAVLSVTLPATTGVQIPAQTVFTGDGNGILYSSDFAVLSVAGAAVLSLTAAVQGVVGNLGIGDALTITSQIAGAESIATVLAVVNTGSEIEAIEAYRSRVLFRIRAVLGGGNATDYKSWGEGVAGVQRVYPYAGKPFDSVATSYPGDRTLYVEATPAVHPDGIADAALLAQVRAAVAADPSTGKSRPPLGLTDSTLFIESIVRTGFTVEITALDVPDDSVVEARADVQAFLELYFLSVSPFIESVDQIEEKNSVLTDLTVSKIVQDVLQTYGGTAQAANFRVTGGALVDTYTLDPNEKARLDAVVYA